VARSAGLRRWNILKGMVSHSVLAACGLAAVFGLSSLAQSSSAPAQAPAQAQPAAPKLQLQDLPPEPHTPTPAELQQQHDQAVLNAAMRLATMQAHWGPEMDSPGVSIALTETGRTKTAQGTTITYQITGSGFTPDEKLMLVRWPLNAEARAVMAGINFDAKGVAVCSDTAPAQADSSTGASSAEALAQAAAQARGSSSTPAPAPNAGNAQPGFVPPPSCAATMQPQQPVAIQVTAAQGEAVRVALMTVDRKHGAAASTIPFPLANTDKGCKLQVILGMRDAALVLIDGTGFPANTPLKLQASTGDESRELHPRANAEGHIVVPLLSGAKGQTSGETIIKFTGLNRQPTLDTSQKAAQPGPDCAPAVSFRWGDGSYKTE
jgi:hypothetical protein